MSDKILHAVIKPVSDVICDQCVDSLSKLLEDAKKGDITEFMMVYKMKNGNFAHCWTGTEDLIKLVGHLSRMIYKCQERMDPR